VDYQRRRVDGRLMAVGRHYHGDHDCRHTVGAGGVQYCAYTLLPFGHRAVNRAEYTGQEDVGTSPFGTLGNLIWLVLAGWWLALAHLIIALGLAITQILKGVGHVANLQPTWLLAQLYRQP